MKNQTPSNLVIRSSLALALAVALWAPVQAQSAAPEEGKKMTESKMMECCQMMKEQKHKLMTEMKAQDAVLAGQVAALNSAPADKKVTLMAAVITCMAEQRATMNGQMEKMHEGMMQHMMQHMQMNKESMSQCPMMKGTEDDQSATAAKELPLGQK